MGRLITVIAVAICLIGMISCAPAGEPTFTSSPPANTPTPWPPKHSYEPAQTSPPKAEQLIPTEYKELPKFNYIGITPPPGEPYDLYSLLVQLRHRSNWSSLYIKHEFDCSEMSGFMENYLELNGFDTYILVAELTGRDWANALEMELERLVGLSVGDKIYHAWLAVNIDNDYLAVEATIPLIDNYYGAYKYLMIYGSAKEAEKAMPGQFDWWNSSQWQRLRSW